MKRSLYYRFLRPGCKQTRRTFPDIQAFFQKPYADIEGSTIDVHGPSRDMSQFGAANDLDVLPE